MRLNVPENSLHFYILQNSDNYPTYAQVLYQNYT